MLRKQKLGGIIINLAQWATISSSKILKFATSVHLLPEPIMLTTLEYSIALESDIKFLSWGVEVVSGKLKGRQRLGTGKEERVSLY